MESDMWGCRIGDMRQPGYKPYSVPSFIGKYGALVKLIGSDLTPLIDTDGMIYVTARHQITKLDDDGVYHWRVRAKHEDTGSFAATPVLYGKELLTYTDKGFIIAFNTKTGKESWNKKYCEGGSVVDMSAVALSEGCLVVPGKDSKDNEKLAFCTDIYCLDAKNGKEKWKVKSKLGVMCFVPSIVDGLVVFQSINGEVSCHSLKDGAVKWMSKPAGQVSTGCAVICAATNMVYSTANLRGKKEWNAPSGGKGSIRAFDLKTGDVKWEKKMELEANAPPAVAPAGPDGKQTLFVGIGANPGAWEKPTGDSWPAAVLAVDAMDGSDIWAHGMHHAGGLGGTNGEARFKSRTGVCFSHPVVALNRVILSWHGCSVGEFDSATGYPIGDIGASPTYQGGAALAPNLLVFCSLNFTFIFREKPLRGHILRDLEVPLEETGCEHFWPHKMHNLEQTGFCELPATADVTKPTWVAGDIEKHFAREKYQDFYHKTPVVDSQRNVYMATNASHVIIVRPDGNLRGHIDCGAILSNICLHDRHLYVCNGAGYCVKVDIETLVAVWNVKFADYTATDSWNPCVCDKFGILIVGGQHRSFIPGTVGGNQLVYGINIEDGSVKWYRCLYWISYNLLPSVWEDWDMAIWSDNIGGMYCHKISNGELIWEVPQMENVGGFTTGHCASCPNGFIYNAYNLKTPPGQDPLWNRGAGAGGVIRAHDICTGETKWMKVFQYECHVAPVTVRKPGSDGYVVVCAQGCQGGHIPPPNDYILPDDADNWPSGDAWEASVVGLDAETGDELWRFHVPVWRHYEARGTYLDDVYLPDCFGSPGAAGNGRAYVIHWSGTLYCLDVATGEVISSSDVGSSSQSAPVIVPGTLFAQVAYNLQAYRDEKLELEWLETARAAGDRRADPRLWKPTKQEITQADKDCITSSLSVSPAYSVFPITECILPPLPNKLYCEETWLARLSRLKDKAAKEEAERAAPAAASAPAAKAAPEAKAAPPAPPAETAEAAPAQVELWEVVGGGKAGGINVRKLESLKSTELGRLSTGSKIKQLELKGERLHYEKVSGEGPDFGWVSLTFKGTDLVKRA